MPKLPDKFALRGSSVPNARPAVVGIRGGQMARAVQGLGDDITRTGKIVEYEQKKKEAEEDDLNIARARSHFLTGKVNLESTLDDDADYENWDAKYAEKMGVLRNEAAALITNPKSRERFTLASNDDFARGVAFVRGRKKERQNAATLGEIDTTIANGLDAALKAKDKATADALLDSVSQAIDGGVQRGVIDPLAASKKKREIASTYAFSYIQTLPLAEQRRLLSGGAGGGDEASYRNNIGNLVVSGAAWQGKGAPFKGTFETFATPEEGVAANFKNIQAIAQKQGGSITLSKLASIWAPADDGKTPLLKGNNPAAWAASVGKIAGLEPNQPLPLDDPQKMAAVMRGINKHEHGKETVPANAYLDGVRLARGEIKVASADPKAPLFTADPKAKGLIEPGNINLMNRPAVKNADGSVSSVRSMSVNIDGKEVLIPTVSDDGRIMSDDEAVAQFEKTGRHLGKFKTPEEASAYADTLHNQQASLSQPAKTGTIVDMIPMPQRIALQNKVEDEWQKEQDKGRVERETRATQQTTETLFAQHGFTPEGEAKALGYIRANFTGKAQNDRITAYTGRAAEARRIDNAATDGVFDTALRKVWDGKASEITPAEQAALEKKGQWDKIGAEIMAFQSGNQKITDWQWLHENYLSKPPAEQAKVPLATLKEFTSRSEYEKIYKARKELAEDDPGQRSVSEHITARLKPLSIDPKSTNGAAKVDAFHREFEARVTAWQTKNGMKMPPMEQKKIVDELTGKLAIERRGMFNDIEEPVFVLTDPNSTQAKRIAGDTGIPADQLPAVFRALSERGIKPTIDNLKRAWEDGTQ